MLDTPYYWAKKLKDFNDVASFQNFELHIDSKERGWRD